MSMDNYGSEGGMMSEINVTPLVDVMLVLLTVFIVTAPLLMNSVSVKLPKVAATTSLQKMNDVKVSITKVSDVYIDETKIAAPTLEAELKKRNSKGDLQVQIMADEGVVYGEVAKAMAQIQRAGVTKFTFVMLPDSAMKSAQ
ncbi:MAG: biopolymer transporter ExbD [Methylophilales bacterium]|nr:biopolymer transporter ExbD [Methylophilales bacterium]